MMPWMSIITWLFTFLVSKSSGASTGKAALLATGAGLATYYLADPSNQENVLGVRFGDGAKATPGSPQITSTGATVDTSSLSSVGKTLISETGATLKSWGPTGTLGVIAGTAAVTSGSPAKWWPWLLAGVGVILLSRS